MQEDRRREKWWEGGGGGGRGGGRECSTSIGNEEGSCVSVFFSSLHSHERSHTGARRAGRFKPAPPHAARLETKKKKKKKRS